MWACSYCGFESEEGVNCQHCGAPRPASMVATALEDTDLEDRVWTDPETGYLCSIKKHPSGHWCGYVMVPWNHPVIGCDCFSEPPVHGGITWSKNHFPGGEPMAGSFVVGFDCNHAWDEDDWKDATYVAAECRRLAEGLKAMVSN